MTNTRTPIVGALPYGSLTDESIAAVWNFLQIAWKDCLAVSSVLDDQGEHAAAQRYRDGLSPWFFRTRFQLARVDPADPNAHPTLQNIYRQIMRRWRASFQIMDEIDERWPVAKTQTTRIFTKATSLETASVGA